MDKITISATHLKNKIADVLNDVYFGRKTVIINRHGKPLVKIVPLEESAKRSKKNFMKLAGVWKDVDADKMIKDIYNARKDGSRKRKFLGDW